MYKHFLLLSSAFCIFVSDHLSTAYNDLAETCLLKFIENTLEIYGRGIMTYNFHSLHHVAADARFLGSLDSCSAFSFETYLYKIKRMVKSGKSPLIEIANRLHERQSALFRTGNEKMFRIFLKRPNNAYVMDSSTFIEVLGLEDSDTYMCRLFSNGQSLFTSPFDSKIIGCYSFSNNSFSIVYYRRAAIKSARNCIMVPYPDRTIFMKFLHKI